MKQHSLKPNEINQHWIKVSEQLNNIKGPKKNAEDWRRYFVDLKSRTKKKAREYSRDIKATGGGENSGKKLTEIEEKLMAMLGWVSVNGSKEMPDELDPVLDIPANIMDTKNDCIISSEIEETDLETIETTAI